MTSLQEKSLRTMLARHSKHIKLQSTKLANGTVSPKSYAAMIARYEDEVVEFARVVSGAEYFEQPTNWKM